ncbi:MAG: hypothetical protein FWD94_04340 [Treponema sp.]|nr:hypothetical protein [Treponema sp.]
MLQIYLLSVLCNGLAGFLFVYGDGSFEGKPESKPLGGAFTMLVGILSAVTGFLKLLIPVERPLLIGDLLPALAGILAGFMLVYGFYRGRKIGEEAAGLESGGRMETFGDVLLLRKKPVGIACIVIAVLHFILPGALFL